MGKIVSVLISWRYISESVREVELHAFLGSGLGVNYTSHFTEAIPLCDIISIYTYIYTGCPGMNVPDFGRMFLKLKYTDITQNTYIQSW